MSLDNNVFRLIPAGMFTMGDDKIDYSPGSRPLHSVKLSSFYISKYQITQEEWIKIMGINPANIIGEYLPVEMVSWYEAIDFCNKLSLKDGLLPCYQKKGNEIYCEFANNGYRLPTEAEWEYAARAGNKSKDYQYSGSDDLNEVAWYKNNSNGTTHDVGMKKPNDLDLYDMSGNVWEWCWDWYGKYNADFVENPTGPIEGTTRVARGGSWLDFSYGCSVGIRSRRKPTLRQNDVGLRLVRANI